MALPLFLFVLLMATSKNHSTFTSVGIASLVGGTVLLTVVAIVAGASTERSARELRSRISQQAVLRTPTWVHSVDFPVTRGALQTAYGGNHDAFVTAFEPMGRSLRYSTYLGGNGDDSGSQLAADRSSRSLEEMPPKTQQSLPFKAVLN